LSSYPLYIIWSVVVVLSVCLKWHSFYVRWRDYYRRVEGIIFFRSSIYLSISFSILFIVLFLDHIYNDHHVEQKHNKERERTEWTKQMDNDDDDDGLCLSLLVWYALASSYFYLKVNRLLWVTRTTNKENICLMLTSILLQTRLPSSYF